MSKPCELCGRPLGEWPEAKRPVMNGEQRMTAWITAIVAACLAGLSGIAYKGCERQHTSEEQTQHELSDTARACIARSVDPAVCLGKIETVRCLSTQEGGAKP